MVLSECKSLYQEQRFIEARLVHDFLSAGWGVHFIEPGGQDHPVTDTYGNPCSFDSLQQAEAIVHQVGDCPIAIDSLFRFAER
ncbi:hypothetical protein [Photobacterium sanguinicancri]|uniref:Uncharacterized protein n=1 Tax=Photobacterium sanguinicancri TaxID=875932 RepID=A0AAW7Y587_9GAMM|nr:hypothetical protein [Photobacterium sanguinicancri]MDO6541765.1 hypothetical protein [Photobacterium sanguinicancri]OZS41301.1 hypothetical protein ASV53_24525 [Photobacterium sanguinicancri]